MQVKPSTFGFMQNQNPQLLDFTVAQLTDAAINIKVGTAYLQYLLTKNGGDLSTAVQQNGTGYYNALQTGAHYLDTTGPGATIGGLYNTILQAR